MTSDPKTQKLLPGLLTPDAKVTGVSQVEPQKDMAVQQLAQYLYSLGANVDILKRAVDQLAAAKTVETESESDATPTEEEERDPSYGEERFFPFVYGLPYDNRNVSMVTQPGEWLARDGNGDIIGVIDDDETFPWGDIRELEFDWRDADGVDRQALFNAKEWESGNLIVAFRRLDVEEREYRLAFQLTGQPTLDTANRVFRMPVDRTETARRYDLQGIQWSLLRPKHDSKWFFRLLIPAIRENRSFPRGRKPAYFFNEASAEIAEYLETLGRDDCITNADAVALLEDTVFGDPVPGDLVSLYRGDLVVSRVYTQAGEWCGVRLFIDGNLLVHGSIQADAIGAQQITAEKIAAGVIPDVSTFISSWGPITQADIADNLIIARMIEDGTITAAQIKDAAIIASKIAANAVVARTIAAGAVTTGALAANAVTAEKIAAGAVDITNQLRVGLGLNLNFVAAECVLDVDPRANPPADRDELNYSIGISHRVPGAVGNRFVVRMQYDGSVDTNTVLAEYPDEDSLLIRINGTRTIPQIVTAINDARLDNERYVRAIYAGSEPTATVNWGAGAAELECPLTGGFEVEVPRKGITGDLIADGVIPDVSQFITSWGPITANDLQNNIIVSRMLANGTVTSDKLGDLAVVAGKIASNAIVSRTIAAGAITSEKILANSIQARHIAAGQITTDKISSNFIYAGQIRADQITSGTISTDRFEAGNLRSWDELWSGQAATFQDGGFYDRRVNVSLRNRIPSRASYLAVEHQFSFSTRLDDGTLRTSGGFIGINYFLPTRLSRSLLRTNTSTGSQFLSCRVLSPTTLNITINRGSATITKVWSIIN